MRRPERTCLIDQHYRKMTAQDYLRLKSLFCPGWLEGAENEYLEPESPDEKTKEVKHDSDH